MAKKREYKLAIQSAKKDQMLLLADCVLNINQFIKHISKRTFRQIKSLQQLMLSAIHKKSIKLLRKTFVQNQLIVQQILSSIFHKVCIGEICLFLYQAAANKQE